MQPDYSKLQFDNKGNLRHFLSLKGIGAELLTQLLEDAERYLTLPGSIAMRSKSLAGRTIGNLFFEPSTRTRASFDLAGRRLGADVLNLDVNTSSRKKGESILDTKGKLILMGIGKSGHIAQKISATLSSTGTSSFFIHPTEAAHGDLGMISKDDAVLILSNSGETKEIIEILPSLKRSTSNIFTLTNNNESTIANAGKINLTINADE